MHKIGVLGGTFNPIHTGHLMLAEWVADTLQLEEIWFLPSGVSYLKKSIEVLPAQERFHMTELGIADNNRFRCLDMEVRRPGNTYTYETLEEIRDKNPDVELFFITGADCLFGIEDWREPERIFAACTLVVANREEFSQDEMKNKKKDLEMRFHAKILLLEFPKIEISSTLIRSLVSEGRSIRYLVPEKVIKYIDEKGFYRE